MRKIIVLCRDAAAYPHVRRSDSEANLEVQSHLIFGLTAGFSQNALYVSGKCTKTREVNHYRASRRAICINGNE